MSLLAVHMQTPPVDKIVSSLGNRTSTTKNKNKKRSGAVYMWVWGKLFICLKNLSFLFMTQHETMVVITTMFFLIDYCGTPNLVTVVIRTQSSCYCLRWRQFTIWRDRALLVFVLLFSFPVVGSLLLPGIWSKLAILVVSSYPGLVWRRTERWTVSTTAKKGAPFLGPWVRYAQIETDF